MSTNTITKVSLSVPGGSEASLVHLHEDCLVQCFSESRRRCGWQGTVFGVGE